MDAAAYKNMVDAVYQLTLDDLGLEAIGNVVTLFTEGRMTYTTGQVIHVDGGYMNIRTI